MNFDEAHEKWLAAKKEYDAANWELTKSRIRLREAEREKRREWDKLVEQAAERTRA